MINAIHQARERLAGRLQATPLAWSEPLGRQTGDKVWLKLETQQPTGSFKVRPALNGMLAHLERARASGVVTSSSGNFAQAVAFAARQLDVSARIVMMRKSSPYKVERTRRWGGEVVFCADTFAARWETTQRIQAESGAVLLHPYDSEATIGADGTVGLEILDQFPDRICVVVPVSGGGLIAGIATAINANRAGCRIVGVQPEANGSITKSLQAGGPVAVDVRPTLADALVAAKPGDLAFRVIEELVDDVVLVDEAEIAEAVNVLANQQKLVTEPGGAVGVAALLAGKVVSGGLPVVIVISGGNVQARTLAGLIHPAKG